MPIGLEEWRAGVGSNNTARSHALGKFMRRKCPRSFLSQLIFYLVTLFTDEGMWFSSDNATAGPCTKTSKPWNKTTPTTCSSTHKMKLGVIAMLCMGLFITVAACVLCRSGDIETNPGPGFDLVSSNLGKVQDLIWDARPKWFNLGLNLDIDQATLTMIKQSNVNGDDCFREMLSEWLKSVEPSWEELLAALRKPSVGHKQLAKKIAGKFSIEFDDSDEGNSTSVNAPANTTALPLATSTAIMSSPILSQPGLSTPAPLYSGTPLVAHPHWTSHAMQGTSSTISTVSDQVRGKDDGLNLNTVNESKFDRDDDFADVLEAVERLAADWDKLAPYLHLRNGDIRVIRKENPGDTRACLNNTMELWLKENYNTRKFGHPSWRTLVKAVARMDMAIAKEIANEHRVGVYTMPPDGGHSSAWPSTYNAATHSLTHPQESYPAHDMYLQASVSGPTQYSVLKKELTQYQLNFITWGARSGEEKKVLRLKQEMSVNWRMLGQNIGISDAELEGFWQFHFNSPIHCMDSIIQKWIQRGSLKYPANWEGLVKLLRDMEMNKLADQILEAAADTRSTLYEN